MTPRGIESGVTMSDLNQKILPCFNTNQRRRQVFRYSPARTTSPDSGGAGAVALPDSHRPPRQCAGAECRGQLSVRTLLHQPAAALWVVPVLHIVVCGLLGREEGRHGCCKAGSGEGAGPHADEEGAHSAAGGACMRANAPAPLRQQGAAPPWSAQQGSALAVHVCIRACAAPGPGEARTQCTWTRAASLSAPTQRQR